MQIRTLLSLLGMALLIAGCASNPVSNRYVGNTDYASLSENESPAKMGVRYLLGRGVPQSDSKAFEYFSTAANDDDPFAENELAYMYAAGKGTAQNYSEAVKYYHKAADHGLASAQYNLGFMYANGLGIAKNNELAHQWYQKSAAHGFEPAKHALAQTS